MKNLSSTSAGNRELELKVLSVKSDGGSEADMETAIETVSYDWSYYSVALESESGLVITLTEQTGAASYSIVSGYNEGEGDLGGEVSRPSESTRSLIGTIELPVITTVPTVQDFKNGISWMRTMKDEQFDQWENIHASNLAKVVADALLEADPNDVDAKEFMSRYTPEFAPPSRVQLQPRLADELLDQVPDHVRQGQVFDVKLSEGLARIIDRLETQAREIQGKNSSNRLDIRVHAAQARISLSLDALMSDATSKRAMMSP